MPTMTFGPSSPEPEPVDPAAPHPETALKLLRIEPPSLHDPANLAINRLRLIFSRPLTFWEEGAAAAEGLAVVSGTPIATVDKWLAGDQALQWALNLASRIDSGGRKNRDAAAQLAADLRTDADRINMFLDARAAQE